MTASGRVRDALRELERLAEPRVLADMDTRYGIRAKKALGVPMVKMLQLAKRLGRDHDLAEALWKTGVYEARTVAALIDEPERVTPAQMERWCRDFDNWGICDTVCFKLFDRSPHAFAKIDEWAKREEEFVKRGAFALLACVALHDRASGDELFLRRLPLAERAAKDDRNFVKKGVLWALRAIGGRSGELRDAVLALAARLAAAGDATARSTGKAMERELGRAKPKTKSRKRTPAL